ncbi:MAG TPA: YibE/F family protein [Bacilli bacterium]|nr:YibE/F family protein [Bacilli bacterium]
MILVLLTILFILFVLIGKNRGIKSFISLLLNFLIISITLLLIYFGLNPIITTMISCILISLITIFYLNGINIKTKASLISIMIVLILIFISILLLNNKLCIEGFSYESIEEIGSFSYNINLNMKQIVIVVILFSIMGAISDTSMAISSAIYEINENTPEMNKKELFTSGMNVGKDILGTTINTLFFVFISVFIGFFVWHYGENIIDIINDKEFVKEVIQVLFSFIGCILIIPITSLITVRMLKNKGN